MTLRPLGPSVTFDGSGQLLHAATHGIAGFLIEGNHFCHLGGSLFGSLNCLPLESGVVCKCFWVWSATGLGTGGWGWGLGLVLLT